MYMKITRMSLNYCFQLHSIYNLKNVYNYIKCEQGIYKVIKEKLYYNFRHFNIN